MLIPRKISFYIFLKIVFVGVFFCLTTLAFSFAPTDIEMNADRVDFDYEKGVSNFEGNVSFEYKGATLRADRAQIMSERRKVMAEGNVIIIDASGIYICERIEYDFDENRGSLIEGMTVDGALVVRGQEVQQLSKEEVIVTRGSMTFSNKKDPAILLKARKITIFPGKELVARDVVFWAGPIPLFYLPVYKRVFDRPFGFRFDLGHNDDFGAQIFTRFYYPITKNLNTSVQLDWYQKRGFGIGINGKAHYDNGWARSTNYFIKDDEFLPTRSQEPAGELDRYMFSLEQYHRFDNGWTSNLDLNILSDIDFHDDFYKERFDETIQVDNRLRLSYSDSNYTVGLSARARLNDFYNVLERMPLLSFDWHTHEIFKGSNIYFTSTNHGVSLEQKYADENREGNEALRFFTRNRLDYSKKFFGWLNFSPGVETEIVWYDDSPDQYVTTSRTYTDELGEEVVENIRELSEEGEALTRFNVRYFTTFTTNLYKLFERSSKPLLGYNFFRHVITPSVTINYQPEPNYENSEVFQFDEFDNRRENQYLTYSIISRWQAKERVNDGATTILNTRYSVTYDLDADDNNWGTFLMDSQLRLNPQFNMDYQIYYDIEDSEISKFRVDWAWETNPNLGFSMGYIYQKNGSDVYTPELTFKVGSQLLMRAYAYYNEEEAQLERSEIAIVRGFETIDLALIYQERNFRDEQTFYFAISPKHLRSGGLRMSY